MDMCEWMCLILCKCVSVWICHSALWLIECWVGAVHCYYSLTTVLGQKREKISLNPIRFLMLTLRIIYKCIQIDVYMLQHTHTHTLYTVQIIFPVWLSELHRCHRSHCLSIYPNENGWSDAFVPIHSLYYIIIFSVYHHIASTNRLRIFSIVCPPDSTIVDSPKSMN